MMPAVRSLRRGRGPLRHGGDVWLWQLQLQRRRVHLRVRPVRQGWRDLVQPDAGPHGMPHLRHKANAHLAGAGQHATKGPAGERACRCPSSAGRSSNNTHVWVGVRMVGGWKLPLSAHSKTAHARVCVSAAWSTVRATQTMCTWRVSERMAAIHVCYLWCQLPGGRAAARMAQRLSNASMHQGEGPFGISAGGHSAAPGPAFLPLQVYLACESPFQVVRVAANGSLDLPPGFIIPTASQVSTFWPPYD